MIRLALFLVLVLVGPARADLVRVETDAPLASVWLIPDASNPGVTVQLVVGAGEFDATGPQGLAHVVEHLVYSAIDRTPGRPRGKPGIGAGHGGQGAAFATGAITTYVTRTSPRALASALAFVARALDPLEVDPAFLASEKRVVVQEYNLRVGGDPVRAALQGGRSDLYRRTPLGRSAIGTPLSIVLATPERAEAFHAAHYIAANATLLVSGPVTVEALREAVETAFADARRVGPVAREWRAVEAETLLDGSRFESRSFDLGNTREDRLVRVAISPWNVAGERDALRESVVLSYATSLLGSALPGSLRRPLQYDAFVARELVVGLASPVPGLLETVLVATAEGDVGPDQLSLALDAALEEAGRGIPDVVFERLKRRLLRSQTRLLDQAPALMRSALADLARGAEIATGRERLEAIASVTKEEVEAVLAALADPSRRHQTVLRGRRP